MVATNGLVKWVAHVFLHYYYWCLHHHRCRLLWSSRRCLCCYRKSYITLRETSGFWCNKCWWTSWLLSLWWSVKEDGTYRQGGVVRMSHSSVNFFTLKCVATDRRAIRLQKLQFGPRILQIVQQLCFRLRAGTRFKTLDHMENVLELEKHLSWFNCLYMYKITWPSWTLHSNRIRWVLCP